LLLYLKLNGPSAGLRLGCVSSWGTLPLLVVMTRDAGMLLADVRLELPVRRKKRARKSQGGNIRGLENEGKDRSRSRRWQRRMMERGRRSEQSEETKRSVG